MSRYDRFMVHVDLGTEEKLADFTDNERLCHVVGVLAIAAKSPIRGLLIVGEAEATAAHVAKRADVSKRCAETTLRKLKEVGILYRDEAHGAWAVHEWEKYNPAPKIDRTNAERQQRYRDKHGARNAPSNAVTNGAATASNGPEVEEEVEVPPTPPTGGPASNVTTVKFGRKPVKAETLAKAKQILAAFNEAVGTRYGAFDDDGAPSENLKRILGALAKNQAITVEIAAAMVEQSRSRPSRYWEPGPMHLGHVFGPGEREQLFEAVAHTTGSSKTSIDALFGGGAA